jgi:hypothetical protein
LNYPVHTQANISVLADDMNDKISYKGIVNILVLLLVASNLKNFYVNYQQEGFILYQKMKEIPQLVDQEFYSLLGFVGMLFFLVFAYLIERLATIKTFSRHVLFFLIVANIGLLLLFPALIIRRYDTQLCNKLYFNTLVIASCLTMSCATISIKLISYHHVWHDLRHHMRRREKRNKIEEESSPRKSKKQAVQEKATKKGKNSRTSSPTSEGEEDISKVIKRKHSIHGVEFD